MAWRDWRAERLFDQGRLVEFAEAEVTVRDWIQAIARPAEAQASSSRGSSFAKNGRITEAEEILQRAVELGLDIEVGPD